MKIVSREEHIQNITMLNQQALKLVDTDASRSATLSCEAMALAIRIAWKEGIAEAIYVDALRHTRVKQFTDAIEKLQNALAILSESTSPVMGKLYYLLGSAHVDSGNYETAMNYLIRSLEICEENNMKEYQLKALYSLGLTCLRTKNYEYAEKYLRLHLAISGETIESTSEASILNILAIIYKHDNKLDDASRLWERSLAEYERKQHYEGMGHVLANLTMCYQELGLIDLARDTNQKAIEVTKKSGNLYSLALALHSAGSLIVNHSEDISEAVNYFLEALRIAESLNDKLLLYTIHKSLSTMHKLREDFELALNHFQKYHKIWEEVFNEKSVETQKRMTVEYETKKAQREAEIHRLKHVELAKAQQIAHLGNWDLNVLTGEITGSDEFYNILGISDLKTISYNTLNGYMSGEDQCKLDLAVKNIDDQAIDLNVRIKGTCEEVKYIHIQGAVEKDIKNPEIKHIVGTFHNITDRVRIENELREHRDHLEELVKQRTFELENSRDQLKQLAAHLQYAREEERLYIAREIHDELGQVLTALKYEIKALKYGVSGKSTSDQTDVSTMNEMIDSAIQTVRKIATELRPKILDELGLNAAVKWFTEEFQKRTGINCELITDAEEVELDANRKVAVFRIVQEALNNVVRHARAQSVKVKLVKLPPHKRASDEPELRVEVTDDGVGIPTELLIQPASIGLTGMRERAEQFGGETKIQSEIGKGTTVTAYLSIPKSRPSSKIKVLLADDHPVARKGILKILDSASDISVVDEAENGQEVLRLADEKHYDVLVLDISMPGIGGLEALKVLKKRNPGIRVLIMSARSEEEYGLRAIKAGASGYLTKDSAPEKLVEAIRKLGMGLRYITPTIAALLADAFEYKGDQPVAELLSDREYQVMMLIVRGKTNNEIGDELFLSPKTISTYRGRILMKLNLKRSKDLIQYAIDHKLFD